MMTSMLTLILVGLLRGVRTQRSLVFENLALRHQLAVLQRTAPRPRLRTSNPPDPRDRAHPEDAVVPVGSPRFARGSGAPCAGFGHLAGPLATRYRAAAPTEGARPRAAGGTGSGDGSKKRG
jgi:hypothetical protein